MEGCGCTVSNPLAQGNTPPHTDSSKHSNPVFPPFCPLNETVWTRGERYGLLGSISALENLFALFPACFCDCELSTFVGVVRYWIIG